MPADPSPGAPNPPVAGSTPALPGKQLDLPQAGAAVPAPGQPAAAEDKDGGQQQQPQQSPQPEPVSGGFFVVDDSDDDEDGADGDPQDHDRQDPANRSDDPDWVFKQVPSFVRLLCPQAAPLQRAFLPPPPPPQQQQQQHCAPVHAVAALAAP